MSVNETTGESITTESSTSTTNAKAVEVNGLALFDSKGDPIHCLCVGKCGNVALKGLTNEGQKVALLLHSAGIEVQGIRYTMVPVCQDTSRNTCLVALDNNFTRRVNVPCTSSNAAVEWRNYLISLCADYVRKLYHASLQV